MQVVCDLDIISQKLWHAKGLADTPNEISTSTGAGSLSFFWLHSNSACIVA